LTGPGSADDKLRVLFEDAQVVVVQKPPGLLVVRGRGSKAPTVMDLAQAQFGSGIRPVHRLDRGTTGALIFAKTPFAQQALSDAFRRHLVDKRYVALVEGECAFSKLAVDARLLRVDNPKKSRGPMAHQTVDPGGQRAMTRIRVWAKNDGLSVVEARPETGRMHQIRAHLAHVGHPLLGDRQYGAQKDYPHGEFALLAWGVSFPKPKGGRAFVMAEMPPELLEFLESHEVSVKARLWEEAKRFSPHEKKEGPRPSKKQAPKKGPPGKGKATKKGRRRR
jgi:tRNA pseudouridine32 synthase/23S rRNA pseudouridine746 synthase